MLDHMTFHVRDLDRAKTFHAAALAPLGYSVCVDQTFHGVRVVGLGQPAPGEAGNIDTWLVDAAAGESRPATTGCHLAWTALSRQAVDDFHAGAVSIGGIDHGAPGPRAHYHPNCYGVFVINPEGNNIEAVCHAAP